MAIIEVNAPSAYTMFVEDITEDSSLAPQLSDPERIPHIEAFYKGTFPHRTPDISTPRTDVYITGWTDRAEADRDPFWRDWDKNHQVSE